MKNYESIFEDFISCLIIFFLVSLISVSAAIFIIVPECSKRDKILQSKISVFGPELDKLNVELDKLVEKYE